MRERAGESERSLRIRSSWCTESGGDLLNPCCDAFCSPLRLLAQVVLPRGRETLCHPLIAAVDFSGLFTTERLRIYPTSPTRKAPRMPTAGKIVSLVKTLASYNKA